MPRPGWWPVGAHKAFGLPLAQKVKSSENDQLLVLGDGSWNVTTDIGGYKLIVGDPRFRLPYGMGSGWE